MKLNRILLVLLAIVGILATYSFVPTTQSKEESQAITQIATQKDLEYFTTHYYEHNRTDLVSSALKFIDGNSIMLKRRAEGPLVLFFNRIFHDNPGLNESWSEVLRHVKLPVRVAFLRSMNLSEAELLAEQPLTPMKNDMYWALYFASGDLNYIKKIVDILPFYDQEEDLKSFLASSEAKVSLSVNAQKSAVVKNYLRSIQKGSPYDKAIEEILTTKPEVLHAAALTKANENKAKGLWQ